MAALINRMQNKLWRQMLQQGIYCIQTHGLDKCFSYFGTVMNVNECVSLMKSEDTFHQRDMFIKTEQSHTHLIAEVITNPSCLKYAYRKHTSGFLLLTYPYWSNLVKQDQ